MTQEKMAKANVLLDEKAGICTELLVWREEDGTKHAGRLDCAFGSHVAQEVWQEWFAEFKAEVVARLENRLAEIEKEFAEL